MCDNHRLMATTVERLFAACTAGFQPSSFEMRCTVPVPMPSDLWRPSRYRHPSQAAFAPSVRSRCLWSAELYALSDGALETCSNSLADHRPLKLSKGAD